MRGFKLLLILLSTAVCAVLASAPASATIITNVTTSATLFVDDFEGMGTAVSQAAYPDTTGSYNPTGWIIGESSPENIQVTNHLGSGDPGAFQGSNYLRLVRPNVTGGAGTAQVDFATQSAGNQIHMEAMLYIGNPSAEPGTAAAQVLGFTTGAWPINIVAGLYGTGNTVASYSGGWQATGLNYIQNQWQKWQIDWTVGNPTFALSIDGNTASSVVLDTSGNYNALSTFWFGPGPGCTMYVDSTVPEPSTTLLLLTGCIGLLAYAWRKQK